MRGRSIASPAVDGGVAERAGFHTEEWVSDAVIPDISILSFKYRSWLDWVKEADQACTPALRSFSWCECALKVRNVTVRNDNNSHYLSQQKVFPLLLCSVR